MAKIYLLLAVAIFLSSFAKAQVNYGSCQTVPSGSPCFFGLYNFYITNVSFGTLNFTGGTCDDTGYLDLYSADSGTVTAGNSYTLTITKGGSGGDSYMMAWVDWNNDGSFDDPGDQLFPTAVYLQNFFGSTVATINGILVPVSAVNGAHRMRVRSDGGSPATNPCATSGSYGDTKDFKLIVTGGGNITCSNMGGTASANPSSVCSGLTSLNAVTGFKGSIQWQQSVSGNLWTNVSGGSGDTSANYTTPVLTSTTYYRAALSQTGCPAQYSTTDTVIVNPPVTPTISIMSTPPTDTICAGQQTDFTVIVTNAGSAPQYKWFLNNINQADNSGTFSSSFIENNDIIKCELISDATCATVTDTSASVTITVLPVLTPVISILSNPPTDTICGGQQASFSTNVINEGVNPQYKWFINNINQADNSGTFSSSIIENNDIIKCELISDATCATVTDTSASVTIAVLPVLTPVISISASPSDTTCQGESVTFSTRVSNGGSSPVYQWKLDGEQVGLNLPAFSTGTLSNGDTIRCTINPGEACASPATSNLITMTVNPLVKDSVSLTANPPGAICTNTLVAFTASVFNGGLTPSYQWKLNGSVTGGDSAFYSGNAFSNLDIVTCLATSNALCVTGSPAMASDTLTVSACTGTNNLTAKDNYTISPNPTNGTFTFSSGEKLFSIQVFDIEGKLIAEKLSQNQDINSIIVDLNNNARGIYFLRAITSGGIINSKLIVD